MVLRGDNVLFKWAVIDGPGREEGNIPGNLNLRPRNAIPWLLSHALSLAALSYSLIRPPLFPSHLSVKESHILYILVLGLQPGPHAHFTHGKASSKLGRREIANGERAEEPEVQEG